MTGLAVVPYGDSALLALAPAGTAEERWRVAQRLADALEADRHPGVSDVVATYDAVLVEFDCARTTFEEVAAALREARPAPAARTPATLRVPVSYGGQHGPDLFGVADSLGLTPAEVVRRHAMTPWIVRFRGSPAGAPMLDGPAFPAPVRRCPRPRVRVPPGSVAVAGHQSVVYPVASPGGWRLIGRTALGPADLDCRPGDVLRFELIDAGGHG